eukprot:8861488-Pyramimonas_sp.AAC.1
MGLIDTARGHPRPDHWKSPPHMPPTSREPLKDFKVPLVLPRRVLVPSEPSKQPKKEALTNPPTSSRCKI